MRRGDLGLVAEEARPTDAAARFVDNDRVTARGEGVGDIGPVDPRMAAADAVFAAAADHDLGFVCRWHVGPAFSGGNVRREPLAAPLHHAESAGEIE